MAGGRTCCVCGAGGGENAAAESASVRSNVRRFAGETFTLWRCRRCGSIHAADGTDLARYYRDYPFRRQRPDWILRRCYASLLGRLRRAGVGRSQSILDYGCGSGLLVAYLKSRGYARAAGYDAYTPAFSDPAALERRYDCLNAQDVLEHADDPLALLRRFDGLVVPGGLVVIGAPDADGIDLARPERFVHSLHQPYHRHILSRGALLAAAADLGWTLRRLYRTPYTNTRWPFVNTRFILHYFRCFDDVVDLAFERRLAGSRRLLTDPLTLVEALFGSFRCPPTEMMAVFVKAT
jgi:SAM-dependent methyltransferase